MTNESGKTAAKTLANDLAKIPGVTDVTVDDWGTYNNFGIIIALDMVPNHGITSAWRAKNTLSLHKLVPAIKRVCNQHKPSHFAFDPLERVYTTCEGLPGIMSERIFEGYDKNYIYLSAEFSQLLDTQTPKPFSTYDFNAWYEETYGPQL